MSCMDIYTIPQMCYGHMFSADKYEIELASNRNLIEISYLIDGELTLQQDGEISHAVAGDFLCNTYHSPLYIHTDKPHRHQTICFNMEYQNHTVPLVFHPATAGARSQALIGEIIRIHTLYPGRKFAYVGLFFQLIDELERMYTTQATSFYPHVRRAKRYIFEHIHEPIKQTDIAAHLGITPEYLCTIFKKSEGVSLIPYINKTKLEHLRLIMEKEKISLHQAAALFGYNDPNYVSRLYKRLFGHNITDNLNIQLTNHSKDK